MQMCKMKCKAKKTTTTTTKLISNPQEKRQVLERNDEGIDDSRLAALFFKGWRKIIIKINDHSRVKVERNVRKYRNEGNVFA